MKSTVKLLVIILLSLISGKELQAQSISLEKVEPPNWWTGMETNEIQLLIYGKNISETVAHINHSGVELDSVIKVENPNYLFLDISISENLKPGTFDLVFAGNNGEELIYKYTLKPKKNRLSNARTVDASDVMYLITPDRFSNGDPTNDSTYETVEKADRSDPNGRHGGDIVGIINHLDYIKHLGVTTIWLNPFLENDQPKYSYHGYGISDFYKTDSRFGTNEDYKELVNLSHQNDMKVIMDQVFNHCGAGHWWLDDLPTEDWLNQWEEYTSSNFINTVISDPYHSKIDHDLHVKGWFDVNLPDLNLSNSLLATYLIQNSIWWIEYANIDGIRMDTHPYPNNKFLMADWIEQIENEYPNFYIVAETAMGDRVSSYVYWNNGKFNRDGYVSNIKSLSDYALYYNIIDAFQQDGQIYNVYETLSSDYLYETPYNNKIFNGNHDVPRLFTELGQNKEKVMLSMAFIFTTRGIPQIYYGDELLFDSPKPDGQLRYDFPGGWNTDKRSAFSEKERTAEENEVINYIKKILDWRKKAVEIHKGTLKHYKPHNNTYVYFRTFENESTMIILNNDSETFKNFDLSRFKESLKGYHSGEDIISGKIYSNLDSIEVEGNRALIIKLKS